MVKYDVIFCFLNKDGSIETDDYGCEMYHREQVKAESEQKAEEIVKEFFKGFEKQPQIIKIIGE